ncbi:prenyltransferase [Streptomyces sp. NPDC012888]|uniref:prenyltransferase n=1 Tax=Streptomyces sp. NPDC012888 TaxID=3364855 RepID=UPI0036792951
MREPRCLPGAPDSGTLGDFTSRQLLRLCAVTGLDPADAGTYADTLAALLGPAGGRPLDLPPAVRTFLSDDHTPVEYSLSFTAGAPVSLRVLLEPGCGTGGLARQGRVGLDLVHGLARRWDLCTDPLDDIAGLFLPPVPRGPLALWLALELRPGGVPRVKVYLNPAASGEKRSAETLREALHRLGHRRALASLPEADGYPFLALDLGDWEEPRVKVYLRHRGLAAGGAAALSRMSPGPDGAEIRGFFDTAAGTGPDDPLDRRPALTCHAFTETATGRPSGFTLHIPVRDYAGHDGEALDRAAVLLRRYGMDPEPLARALSTVTARRLEDGVGLIAYLALVHQHGHPPRVTAYVSSEAYAVRPPRRPAPLPEARHPEAVH